MSSEGKSGGSQEQKSQWKLVHTPFDADLEDVERAADGTYAVGTSGTMVADYGNGWEVVFDQGPDGGNRTLHTLTVTDDGQRLWFAGASGVVGMYDINEKSTRLYSIESNESATWKDIGVFGKSGEEHGLLANSSGEVVPFTVEKVDVDWGTPEKPGEGAAVTSLTMVSDGTGFAVDTAGKVYRRGYEGWDPLGTVNAQTTFTDIYADPGEQVFVTAQDGSLYRLDPGTKKWNHISIANTGLLAVDVYQKHILVLAANGTVYWRHAGTDERWRRQPTPGNHDLLDVVLGYPDIIVGKSGAVLERPPSHREKEDPKHKEKLDPKKEKKVDPTKKKKKLDPCEGVEEVVVRVEECGGRVEERVRERVQPRRRRVVKDEAFLVQPVETEVVEGRRRGRRVERRGGEERVVEGKRGEVIEVVEEVLERRC